MTADHTPERLDPFAGCTWRDDRDVEVMNVSQARAILAAHLADVEARLAKVEALAGRWQRLATIAGSGRVGTTAATAYTQASDELVVALRTSEALVDGLFADTHRASNGGHGLPPVTENLGLKPEGALNFPRQDAEVSERVKGDFVVGAESERQEGALGGVTGLGGGVEHESTLVDLGGESQPGLTTIHATLHPPTPTHSRKGP